MLDICKMKDFSCDEKRLFHLARLSRPLLVSGRLSLAAREALKHLKGALVGEGVCQAMDHLKKHCDGLPGGQTLTLTQVHTHMLYAVWQPDMICQSGLDRNRKTTHHWPRWSQEPGTTPARRILRNSPQKCCTIELSNICSGVAWLIKEYSLACEPSAA